MDLFVSVLLRKGDDGWVHECFGEGGKVGWVHECVGEGGKRMGA